MALSGDPIKRDCQLVRFKAVKAGMTEDQYKDWLQDLFGVRSATELTDAERRQAHGRLNKLLNPKAPPSRGLREPQIQKLEAIWAALAAHGAVRNGSPEALERWCKRQQPRLDALRFADVETLQHLIEALKKWQRRVGAPAAA